MNLTHVNRSLLWVKRLTKPAQCSHLLTNQRIFGFAPLWLSKSNQKRMYAGGSGIHGNTPGSEHQSEHKAKSDHNKQHSHDGHSHDHDHEHEHEGPHDHTKSAEKVNMDSKEGNNPYMWDPNYDPAGKNEYNRDPMETRKRDKETMIPKAVILERIVKVCKSMERAQTQGKVITEDTHLANDLGLDSLDLVEFGLGIEDEFDIEIPDEQAEQIVTVGDAVELIADHPQAR